MFIEGLVFGAIYCPIELSMCTLFITFKVCVCFPSKQKCFEKNLSHVNG